MFDKEQFIDEIEAQLADISKHKRGVFAWRALMRVLPLLSLQKKMRKKIFTLLSFGVKYQTG